VSSLVVTPGRILFVPLGPSPFTNDVPRLFAAKTDARESSEATSCVSRDVKPREATSEARKERDATGRAGSKACRTD